MVALFACWSCLAQPSRQAQRAENEIVAPLLLEAGAAAPTDADDTELELGDSLPGERFHLLSVFLVGSVYSYCNLMIYPLYKELVRVRGGADAPVAVVTFLLTMSKLLVGPTQSALLHVFGTGLTQVKILACVLFSLGFLALVGATAAETDAVVVAVCTFSLNFLASRVLNGSLLAVPAEGAVKLRTFIYDLAAQPGCLWLSLVAFLLGTPLGQSNLGRLAVMSMPLAVGILGWLLVQRRSYFDGARLKAIQALETQRLNEKLSKAGARKLDDIDNASTAATSREPSPERIEKDSSPKPWADARFRVLAATSLLSWWSYNFYGYTVFPVLITEQGGPPLATVTALYTVEGLVYSVIIATLLPYLKSRFFALFLVCNIVECILPPLAICVMPYLHWSGYLVVLTMMDMCSSVNFMALGTVLLRCLPWDLVPIFNSQVNAIGLTLCALSMGQLSVHEHLGWAATSIIGHAIPLLTVLLVFATHRSAVIEIHVSSNKLDVAA